jgi:ribosomal protein L31
MKANLHPNWHAEAKVVCACGSTFITGSTLPEIRVEICSACHPFFTGTQKFVDTLGQVDRFVKKVEISKVKQGERKKILEARKCSIMLIDKESQELCIKASGGLEENIEPVRIKIDDSAAAKVIQDGQPLLVKDIESDPQFHRHKKACYVGRSFMIVPIKRDGDIIGVVNVADKHTPLNQDDVFNELDLKILCDIAREVSVAMENVKFYKELQYLTITDPLTSIHNFRHFAKSLDYEIKRLKRISGELGLLMMDIDDFKSYNDQFGHPAGDQLLKEIGKNIQKNLREIDILCRYAGDEFVIILPGTDKIGSAIVSERIRKSIEQVKFKKPVTVSIGVAQFKKEITKWLILLTLFGFLLLGFLYVASYVIPIIFQGRFLGSGPALRILALGMPLFFISALIWHLLIIVGKQKNLLYVYAIGAIFNVGANIILIPTYGYLAAATISVVSEALILLMLVAALKREL